MSRTLGARGEAKLNRTLGESPTDWRVRQQPLKKNTPCISVLAGVKFLLKKERVFSFGVLPSKYSGSVVGQNADEAKQNYFCGRRRICFASTLFVLDLASAAQEGVGRNPRRILFGL